MSRQISSLRPIERDRHLRSTPAVTGRRIHAADSQIGHVESFLIDDSGCDIRYLVIDTRSWWPGQHVLMAPHAVRKISWLDHEVRLDVSREQVRASPAWDVMAIINQPYEKRLRDHYNWPGYRW